MKNQTKKIEIPAVAWDRIDVTLVGLSPLIVNNFDEKSKQQMEDAQGGTARNKKEKKVPKECFERARLRDRSGKDCVMALWIKCAMVDAARFCEGVKMTELRGAIRVDGHMIRIQSRPPRLRTDPVRVGMGKADLRHRPEYMDWKLDITILYRPNLITPDSVINLLNNAGQSIGLCERRMGQNGDTFGMFEVEMKSKRRRAA